METLTPVVVMQGVMIMSLVAAWTFATLTAYGALDVISMAWLGICRIVAQYGAYAGTIMLVGLWLVALFLLARTRGIDHVALCQRGRAVAWSYRAGLDVHPPA